VLPSALAAALLLAAALAVLGGRSKPAVPPPGTVIDATTGEEVARVIARTTPQFVQVGGGAIFRACDLTRSSQCGYNQPGTPVRVRIGDVVEFSIRLFNPDNHQVPYLAIYVNSWSSSAGPGAWVAPTLRWRTNFESHGPTSVSGEPVEVIFPRDVRLPDLTYMTASTTLFGAKGEVVARLPDGIMEGGIALVNVGAPASCSYCESEYTRYVNYKVRVTDDGRPVSGSIG
jgi:hypothetical protein